jgi:indolepyruvate ferredoxin oxidoreductase
VVLNASGKGAVTGLTQMGGEGAQWVGMAPFTDDDHFVQNVGDGTFFHSASLAVRFAVASGQNITFKILVNDAVAMTGGQAIEGSLPVPALTHLLAVEGAKEIVVTTDEPQRYRGVTLGARTSVRDRRDLLDVQQRLAKLSGVTILIHDQQCAAEKRRLRKRGKVHDPPKRVVINERVCEGCGDCGRKSDCLSVRPVDTPFGRKTQIHQASCNKDFSCLDGDCPSFITVVGDVNRKAPEVVLPEVTLTLPTSRVRPEDFSVRMTGVGGTGVVTMSQVLGMAARLEGKHVWSLDQTGLSQKGGEVVSDVRFTEGPGPRANRIPAGAADLYLAFDLLAGTSPKNLVACSPERTAVVASTSAVPTGTMVIDQRVEFPALDDLISRIRARARDQQCLLLDAERLSQALFQDDVQANAITLGAAFQQGFLPLELESIERAFQLNGASVAKNLAAFAWGRACVAAPEVVQRRLGRADETVAPGPRAARAAARLAGDPALQQLVAARFEELCAYQDERYANRYVEFVGLVGERVQKRVPSAQDELTSAIAHNLHKLMAYKDEYEVARLHLDANEQARIRAQFGPNAKMRWHLHPPILRALGLRRKVVLGPWFTPAFSALRGMRRLRGTRFDPFGYAKVRRVERDLIGEYESAIDLALEHLTAHNYSLVVKIAELPDMVRGYEDIKLANVASYRAELHRLLASLGQGSPQERQGGTEDDLEPALGLWT